MKIQDFEMRSHHAGILCVRQGFLKESEIQKSHEVSSLRTAKRWGGFEYSFRLQTSRQAVRENMMVASSALHRRVSETIPAAHILDRKISVIATDVDGTLLDSSQNLSERTERAIHMATEQGVKVILATGKARGPWVGDILPRLGLSTPGVFMQGLLIYGADGEVLYDRKMREDVALDVLNIAEANNMTAVAYCGEQILCDSANDHTDRLIGYGEPVPEAIGSLRRVVGKTPIHKILFMGDDSKLSQLRPHVESQMGGRASLVTALHGMLEFLPPGASKAVGLARVLEMIDVSYQNVMAVGDGENDMEMLRMSGFSVAMGNAGMQVKGVADFVTTSNDNDGLARVIEQFVLPSGFWCWD